MNRLIQLDLLRFLAVILVMGRHMTICPPETSVPLNQVTTLLSRGGWVGVDLFFVLSGFLISGLLFREYQQKGSISIKRFLIRRGLKIYPSFWVLLIVSLIIFYLTSKPILIQPLLSELFFLQNYAGNLWSHTWSLAVEEHFYIGLALLFFVMLRLFDDSKSGAFRLIPWVFVLIAVGCFALRILTTLYVTFSTHVAPTHLRIDSLFFGVFISYLWHFRGLSSLVFSRVKRGALVMAGILLLSPAFIFDIASTQWIVSLGLSMFYVGSGCLLVAFLKSDLSRSRAARSLAFFGMYSYSIYLWHLPIAAWLPVIMPTYATDQWFVYALAYFALALGLGVVISKIVEFPVLKLRDMYFPSRIPPDQGISDPGDQEFGRAELRRIEGTAYEEKY